MGQGHSYQDVHVRVIGVPVLSRPSRHEDGQAIEQSSSLILAGAVGEGGNGLVRRAKDVRTKKN